MYLLKPNLSHELKQSHMLQQVPNQKKVNRNYMDSMEYKESYLEKK